MDDGSIAEGEPSRAALIGYIESMLLELAELASVGGESALAATLAMAAIQAAGRRREIAE